MNELQLFYGPLRPVFFSSLLLIMLLLMFIMSLRLYLNRRKKAYVAFTVALILLMFQYAFVIAAEIAGVSTRDWAVYAVRLMKFLSFIYVNWGVYRLYNSSAAKHQLVFILLTAVGVIISMLHFVETDLFDGAPVQLRLLQDVWLELYFFLVMFYFYARITPRIGQTTKYQLGLALFFASHSVHLVHEYGLDGRLPLLYAVENALTLAYFITLFMLLFERVVELLQAIYTSSITDALTGLYNRRYFMNHVQHYVLQNAPVSIIFSDIDNFKKLNDTQGHQRGDDALRQVAQIVKDACGDIGVCGRYGGEEMVVLVTDPNTDAGELAETIRRRVETEAGVTVSVGYSKLKRGITPDELVKQADEAMYVAKTTGKNKVAKYMKQTPLQIG